MAETYQMICIGESQHSDSLKAGQQAARMALNRMEPESPAAWVMAFCGGRHDPEVILQGLRSEFGDVEIVGGAAVGTISNSLLGYTGYECAVAAFPSSSPKPAIVQVGGPDEDDMDVGRQLGGRL